MHRRLALVTLLGLLTPTLVGALEVSVSWSPPRVYAYPPPSDLSLEGAVEATFHGDEAMTPADPSWLTRINATTWRGAVLWNDLAPIEVIFLPDAGGEPDTVTAIREPAFPYDPARHDALVIEVDTAPEHLWSPETGIYVWGLHENCLQRGEEWERPAQITAHAPDGSLWWSEPAGLRINGQSTRYQVRKGLRSYFDDHGTADWIEADLFGDGPERFARLVYKSTFLTGALVSSSLWEPLHQDLGHLGSRHRLAGLYLGGEYWGAYSLRERLDDEFVEVTHALAGNNEYKLIKDNEAEEGDLAEWDDFLATYAVPPQDYDAHDWYAAVSTRLDLGAYIDWLYLNIHGASSDNGWVNNVALLKVSGGPWQYIMWDEEGLMASLNLESDHFRFYAAADAAEFEQYRPAVWSMGDWWPPHQPWRDLFRGLMQNSEFKARFAARIDELLAGPLSLPSLNARLDSLQADQTQELANHQLRWNQWSGAYASEMLRVRGWLAAREPIVAAQRAEFFASFAVPVELSRFDAAAAAGGATLTWRTERERDNRGFQVWRSLAGPDDLSLLTDWRDHPELAGAPDSDAPREYLFVDATYPAGQTAWYQLRHESLDGTVAAHRWIERAGPPALPALRLNELMADNDHVIADEAGEFEDWIELHNAGPDPLPLLGLALSDDPAASAPWPLPDLVLEPGQYLLVWCDNDLDQGPLHADFKLSASGESAVLFLLDDGETYVMDSVEFGPQTTDVSYGRLPDDDGPWQILATPTPGASNDGTTATTATGVRGLVLHAAHPNPLSVATTVRFATGPEASGPVRVAVYDLRGRLVREVARGDLPAGDHAIGWDRRDARGRRAPAGVYLVRVTAGNNVATGKLSVVQ
ncbi:MAG: CotH kinase family protein [Candidatus Krumholzibacteriia bacterium]